MFGRNKKKKLFLINSFFWISANQIVSTINSTHFLLHFIPLYNLCIQMSHLLNISIYLIFIKLLKYCLLEYIIESKI